MTKVEVRSIEFKDVLDLPEAHSDERRTIYERITELPDGSIRRISRSVVNADEVVLGNHYHDFNQEFRGCGEGILYTAPKEDPSHITVQELPPAGWAFSLPAGMAMALRLKKGAVHIFESDKSYGDGTNTHRIVLAE